MGHSNAMIPDGPLLRGDPECQYKFLEARVAPSIDPAATIDVACFMTTDTVDADDEVVLPAGADLSRFEKNPVLMLCHAYGQPGCYYPLPIGKVLWTKKRPNGVMAGIAFARSTALGREVKGLFDEDMVRSFSIGFRSVESGPMTRDEARSRADWGAAFERTGGRILVHRKWSLLELSVAPIPSNEDALRAKYRARGLPVPDWLPLHPSREAKMTDRSAVDDGRPAGAAHATKPARSAPDPDSRPDDAPIAEGDDVSWSHKGGGWGRVRSVHSEGRHPEDPGDPASDLLDATDDEPVARVKCFRKAAAGFVETRSEKAIHCKHLTRVPGGLDGDEDDPAPDDNDEAEDDETDADADAEGDPRPRPKAAKPIARRDDDGEDRDEDEDDDPDATGDDGPIRVHDFVRINAPHHKGYGRVKSVHDSGMVPDVDDDVLGTRADPAARVKCYKAMADGHVATDRHVGHLCKHLEKVAPLQPPSRDRDQGRRPGGSRGKGTSRAGNDPLPPLIALSEQELLEEAIQKLNQLLSPEAFRRMVAEELDQRMGCV